MVLGKFVFKLIGNQFFCFYRVTGVLSLVLGLACYKGLLVSGAASFMQLGSWATLLQDAVVSICLGLVSLQLYLGVTSLDKY